MNEAINIFCQAWAVDVARQLSEQPASSKRTRPLIEASTRPPNPKRTCRVLRSNGLIAPTDDTEAAIDEPVLKKQRTRSSQMPSRNTGQASRGGKTQGRGRRPLTAKRAPGIAGHEADDDQSLRSRQPGSSTSFPFSPMHTFPRRSGSDSETANSDSQRSSERSHSPSPTRALLQHSSRDQFDFKNLSESKPHAFPIGLQRMRDALELLCDRTGVLPSTTKVSLLDNALFQATELTLKPSFFDPTEKRIQLGGSLSIDQALKFSKISQACVSRGRSEASWNALIHLPLILDSLELCPDPSVVDAELLTTAMIQPSGLCPMVDSALSTTRKVDIGIVLRLPKAVERRLQRTTLYVNQTYYQPVSLSPITVSIETKLAGGGSNSAQTQLAVWAFAQFEHLRRIGHGQAPDFLPLLVVEGNNWTFLAATQTPDPYQDDFEMDEQVTRYLTTIWNGFQIGDTSTLQGVWQVSAVIQYLAMWSREEYLPWIQESLGLEGARGL